MGFVERKTHFPCFLLKWVLLEKYHFNKNHFPSSSESEEFRRPISNPEWVNPEKPRQMEKAHKKKKKQKGGKKQRGWKVRGEID
jgi:hypothetical protein